MKINSIPTFDYILTHREFHLACSWVDEFMLKYDLYPESGKALISLSGGADSLLLALVLKQLQNLGKIKKLEFVHFHHGTRKGQDKELEFVKKITKKMKITGDFIYLHLQEKQISNFEMIAREQRYKHLNNFELAGYSVYLGHHIDDSFEWSLMQQFKSSQVNSCLGIPVKNNLKRRPFMCLTRQQIVNVLRRLQVPYIIDPTNADDTYERNFLRNNIIPLIKKKYPSYLKNYVARQNELVKKLHSNKINNKSNMWTSETDSWGGILLARHSTEQKINNEQINNCISKLSVAKRGKTRDQLQKLIQAFKNNRKGPLSFSGGVKIYLEKHTLYFTNREIEQKFETLDKNIYQSLVATQIPVSAAVIKINPLLKQNKKNLLFPELIFCRDKNAHQLLGRSMNNAYKLLPRSTQYLVDHKIWFQLMSKYKKTDSNFTIEMLTLCVSDLK